MNCTPIEWFKRRVKSGTAASSPIGDVLRKQYSAAIEPGDSRQVKFTISTGAVDRDNDTVAVGGWQLNAFLANPVVLWSHMSEELPIGKCVAIGVEGDALKAVVEFVPEDVPMVGPKAQALLRMCQLGFISATSVGFRPLKFNVSNERDDDGNSWSPPIDFISQELMEFSLCSIPSNPEALIDPQARLLQARSADADRDRLARAAAALNTRRLRLQAYS